MESVRGPANDDARDTAATGGGRPSASHGPAGARNALVGGAVGGRSPRERKAREGGPGGRAPDATAARAGLAQRRRPHAVQPPNGRLLHGCSRRRHIHPSLHTLLARRALLLVAGFAAGASAVRCAPPP